MVSQSPTAMKSRYVPQATYGNVILNTLPLVPAICISQIFDTFMDYDLGSGQAPDLHCESMGEILKSFPTHQ